MIQLLCSYYYMDRYTSMDANKKTLRKSKIETTQCYVLSWRKPGSNTHKTVAERASASHFTKNQSKMNKTCGTLLKK